VSLFIFSNHRIKGTNLISGGEYGTALKSAVHNADSDIVALLLSNNADPNIQGELNILHQGRFSR
jgi:hypothetical protein